MTTKFDQHAFDEATAAFVAGRLTKRAFMVRATALGLGAAALGVVGRAEAQTPKRGGSFRIATLHGQSGDTLDPALLFNGAQWMLDYGLRNTLTQIGPGGRLEPCLATEWEPSADAKSWTFTLRQGVEFHDGKTLTVEDVTASIRHHLKEGSESSVKTLAEQITQMKADGNNVIVFDLAKPNVDFPYMFASANFSICPATGDGGIDATSGNGTGGYVLREWQPGIQALVERNPNYWRDDRAWFDQIEMLTVADSSARMNALKSGDVDVIDDVDYKLADLLGRTDGIEVEATNGPLHYLFSLMSTREPFGDVNVRLAMKYAIDREKLVDTVLNGYGVLGNDNPIGPSYPSFDPNLEQRTYDPDKAMYHLKQAGYDRLPIEIHAGDAAFSAAVDAAVLYQEAARPAGIDITVVREPADGYWSDVYMQVPAFANYWGGYTTASEMLATGYLPGTPWNESMYESEAFAALLDQANGELDPARRLEMMSELQGMVRDEAGQVIFAFPSMILGRSDRVAHGELASDRPLDGRLIFERWWAA